MATNLSRIKNICRILKEHGNCCSVVINSECIRIEYYNPKEREHKNTYIHFDVLDYLSIDFGTFLGKTLENFEKELEDERD